MNLFQFTPLREGRQFGIGTENGGNQFQFTPLREGRQVRAVLTIMPLGISIHAPAGGATTTAWEVVKQIVFQFTPLREGRQRLRKRQRPPWLFQFTPLREGRPCPAIATAHPAAYFNSRPCGRGDACRDSENEASSVFQFTPLREGRLHAREIDDSACSYFNSRPCGRGDR